MDLWRQKTGFPIRASLNSIRKTHVANLHIGDSVFVTYSSDSLQALNERHEIIGAFNCLPSFYEANLDFADYLTMISQWQEEGKYFDGETVVRFHAERLQTKVVELIVPSSECPKGYIEIEFSWKQE